MSPAKVLLLVKGIFLLLGLVFLGVGFGLSRSASHKKEVCSQPVLAQIVELQRSVNTSYDRKKRTVSWYPIYEYTVGSQTLRIRSGFGGTPDMYQVGDTVQLMVNPADPEEFYNPADPIGMVKTVFLCVGAGLSVASVLLFIIF